MDAALAATTASLSASLRLGTRMDELSASIDASLAEIARLHEGMERRRDSLARQMEVTAQAVARISGVKASTPTSSTATHHAIPSVSPSTLGLRPKTSDVDIQIPAVVVVEGTPAVDASAPAAPLLLTDKVVAPDALQVENHLASFTPTRCSTLGLAVDTDVQLSAFTREATPRASLTDVVLNGELKLEVEPFSKEDDDTVMTHIGGMSLFLELDLWSAEERLAEKPSKNIAGSNELADEVLTYVGGFSLFRELDIDTHMKLGESVDKYLICYADTHVVLTKMSQPVLASITVYFPNLMIHLRVWEDGKSTILALELYVQWDPGIIQWPLVDNLKLDVTSKVKCLLVLAMGWYVAYIFLDNYAVAFTNFSRTDIKICNNSASCENEASVGIKQQAEHETVLHLFVTAQLQNIAQVGMYRIQKFEQLEALQRACSRYSIAASSFPIWDFSACALLFSASSSAWCFTGWAVHSVHIFPGIAFYLPGSYMYKYSQGEDIWAKVNSLMSTETERPFSHYSLTYCHSSGAIKKSDENLGLKEYDAMLLKQRAHDLYKVNMMLDNLPVTRFAEQNGVTVQWTNFRVGNTLARSAGYYSINHLKCEVMVHEYEGTNVEIMCTGEEEFVVISEMDTLGMTQCFTSGDLQTKNILISQTWCILDSTTSQTWLCIMLQLHFMKLDTVNWDPGYAFLADSSLVNCAAVWTLFFWHWMVCVLLLRPWDPGVSRQCSLEVLGSCACCCGMLHVMSGQHYAGRTGKL